MIFTLLKFSPCELVGLFFFFEWRFIVVVLCNLISCWRGNLHKYWIGWPVQFWTSSWCIQWESWIIFFELVVFMNSCVPIFIKSCCLSHPSQLTSLSGIIILVNYLLGLYCSSISLCSLLKLMKTQIGYSYWIFSLLCNH